MSELKEFRPVRYSIVLTATEHHSNRKLHQAPHINLFGKETRSGDCPSPKKQPGDKEHPPFAQIFFWLGKPPRSHYAQGTNTYFIHLRMTALEEYMELVQSAPKLRVTCDGEKLAVCRQ